MIEDDLQQRIEQYLNGLTEAGTINMFGSQPYIMREFGLTRLEAEFALRTWVNNIGIPGPKPWEK